MKRFINAGTLWIGDDSSRGPGVSENSYGDMSFRDVLSPHQLNPNVPLQLHVNAGNDLNKSVTLYSTK